MPKAQPNILFIMTDQQHAGMMSCAGNPYVKTPALDSLAATGMRFERAYCANPVCIPSRFSMMSIPPSLPDARPRSDRFRCGGRKSKFLVPNCKSSHHFPDGIYSEESI